MKKIISIFLAAAMMVFVFAGCKANDNNELVVGMELAYPPFEMTDAQGNPDGISVQMALALGEYLGRPVRIENMAWTGLIPSLTTGKVDLIISSMTITEERAKTVNFSIPYAKAQLSLLIHHNSPVQSFADLKAPGRKLAVKRGTTGHIFAISQLPEQNIVVFEKETEGILEVSQGKADAFIYDALTIYKSAQGYADTTRASFEVFQEEFDFWGMALRKDDTALLEQANAFIRQYREDGRLNMLADTYLGDVKKVFDDQGLPFFFDIGE
ncbi:MAG: transporter substrate-binding domain-containing protein [Clostridia bacterium]